MPRLTLPEFIARWQASTRNERSAAQEHFLDLCDVLGQKRPAELDPTGDFYTFEKGATKVGGGDGFADVWMRDHFAWEYKGKRKNLNDAYQQLLQYREDLENPPLLVVCDLNRFEVHTNFTGTAKLVYSFTLADLASPTATPTCPNPPIEVLRSLFTDPDRLRPLRTTAQVTEEAAARFASLAENIRKRGGDPERAAHFLMRLLFCLFAEDISILLPDHLFTRLVENTRNAPDDFNSQLKQLFAVMATGGYFGFVKIPYFNGGLFDTDYAIDLTSEDLAILAQASALDWSSIEPAIFGTLFERSLDPAKRSQLGAHYTSKEDILLIVEPVLMEPLRRRWEQVQAEAADLVKRRDEDRKRLTERFAGVRRNIPESPHQKSLETLLADFRGAISGTRVLDPACGSGNFLYVALKALLDLEKQVQTFAATNGIPVTFQQVDPTQLYGIEINPYAYELASVVVWIGYIQWLNNNGFGVPSSPILKPLHNIRHMDAILAYDADGKPVEPEWPEADVIIGNPPFLGGQKMRRELGDEYTEHLWRLFHGRFSAAADLVTYWFERSRLQIEQGHANRAGLIATQSIRASASQQVLEHIKQSGDIFLAWSDKPWILDGAAVRVSIVGFDDALESHKLLDGVEVARINSDLTSSLDLTHAHRLGENVGLSFMGQTPIGPFDIDANVARGLINLPANINGRPNSDVVRPMVNAQDLVQRNKGNWIIDFSQMPLHTAIQYEAPFEYVKKHVYPVRKKNSRASRADKWWLFGEPVPRLRNALIGLHRYAATPRVAKHRIFVWLDTSILSTNKICAIVREDDYFLGVLHSRLHELWSLANGSRHGVGNDPVYNGSTCFETYPFPWPPGHEPKDDARVEAIAEAARELVAKRDVWLNPPGATEAELKKRTLTNLYNERPTWLDLAHKKLDRAVFDAYGWPHDLSDEQILERLLALNLERAKG